MNKTDKIFFYLLLVVPFISSLLSTIHIIDLVSLGNGVAMAFAVAITFEISSVISFVATSGSILKNVNKGWLYFIFCMLFILQAVGNVYSGFSYINRMLITHKDWLKDIMEMSFNYFTVSEVKLILSTIIGLPLPIISLVMLKFAVDKASISAFTEKLIDDKSEIEQIKNVPDLEPLSNIISEPGFSGTNTAIYPPKLDLSKFENAGQSVIDKVTSSSNDEKKIK